MERKIYLNAAIAALTTSSDILARVITSDAEEAIESARVAFALARMRCLRAQADCREILPVVA
jgi:hypothetical protein